MCVGARKRARRRARTAQLFRLAAFVRAMRWCCVEGVLHEAVSEFVVWLFRLATILVELYSMMKIYGLTWTHQNACSQSGGGVSRGREAALPYIPLGYLSRL